jgi:hypothetical protein
MTTAKRNTLRATVMKSWSTESCYGTSYFFRLRPVTGNPDGSDDFVSTIPTNVIESAPCGKDGRIHSLVGAEVELTGRWDVVMFGLRRLSNPRGRVVKLTPAMAARMAEEQELDAYLKAQWAKEGA